VVTALLLVLALSVVPADIFPEAPLDEDDVALQEQVERLLASPIDLNRATPADLLEIPWLDPMLAYRIVRCRDSLGGFARVSDIRQVRGVTDEWYRLLAPVVTVRDRVPDWTGGLTARARMDSLGGPLRLVSGQTRAMIERAPWRGVVMGERDRGEPGVIDWLGFGLGSGGRAVSFVLGHYTHGTGLGLVFSGPQRRGSARWGEDVRGPSHLRLVRASLETRGLRGGGVEVSRGGWRAVGFGSWVGRDARLNPDGTVERLRLTGTHDDSAAQAEHNTVFETSTGVTVSRHRAGLDLSVGIGHVRYSRGFAPSDTFGSFQGDNLTSGGLAADFRFNDYRLALEGAVSTGGGCAGALELNGNWDVLAIGLGLLGYQRYYFAPLGRWRSLTGRRDRLYARARFRWEAAGFVMGVRGNTYRDYVNDSLPARIDGTLGRAAGPFRFELRLGRGFRLDQPRYRTSKLTIDCDVSKWVRGTLTLADRYPDSDTGRGRMAALAVRFDTGLLQLALSAARFDIDGTGTRMYLHEPAPMRIGTSFSTSKTGWRFSTGAAVRVFGSVRLALGAGCRLCPNPVYDLGGQLEASVE
jgi:hypothetical protein